MIVTKEELLEYTGVELNTPELAELFIGAAQNIVENYLAYEIESKEYIKHFSLHSSNVLKCGVKNITNVTEITVDGVLVADYYINDDKIILKNPVISDNIIIKFTAGFSSTNLPQIIKLTVLRIAALLQTESNNNIGVSGKSFMDGSRTFINFTNYDKYLISCSKYKLI